MHLFIYNKTPTFNLVFLFCTFLLVKKKPKMLPVKTLWQPLTVMVPLREAFSADSVMYWTSGQGPSTRKGTWKWNYQRLQAEWKRHQIKNNTWWQNHKAWRVLKTYNLSPLVYPFWETSQPLQAWILFELCDKTINRLHHFVMNILR